jgi:hypothetical protein
MDSELSSLSIDDDEEHVFPTDELNYLINSLGEEFID